MFLSAVLTDRCFIVCLAPFLSLLFSLIIWLIFGCFLLIFDEGHHFLHGVGGDLDECFHLTCMVLG